MQNSVNVRSCDLTGQDQCTGNNDKGQTDLHNQQNPERYCAYHREEGARDTEKERQTERHTHKVEKVGDHQEPHRCSRMIQIFCDKLLKFHLLLTSLHLMSGVKCGTNKILTYTAYEKGNVEIQCPYESKYEKHEKYLCRGECKILNKDKPVSSGLRANDKRFSLIDNSTTHIFTVTITDLRPEDEGTYWCGVKTGIGRSDDYTEILLDIKHDVGSLTTMTATSTIAQTIYICSNQPGSTHYTVNPMIVSSSSSTSSLSSSHSYSVSRKLKSDLIVIITMSVTVILLVFGFSLFVCFRQRQKNKDQESSLIDSGKLQETAENGLQSVKNHPGSLPTNLSRTDRFVYATPQLPTNPSRTDRSLYAMPQLPTNPSGTERSVYAMPQLPANTSGTERSVYAMPQLTANPSGTEGSVYAVPQLPANPSGTERSVYATPQLPTNPSGTERSVYAMPQLPANPSGTEKSVYAMPQLPANPSGTERSVYAVPQLTANPSGTEGSVYAVPQLPANPSGTERSVYAMPQLPTNTSAVECSVYAMVQLPKVHKTYLGHDVKADLSSKT
ncbi:uncharacterized protein LOC127444145 isoform X2 [Myxocyprinus asiaticus]|uniref:uncharacterized protein LOC127444145 isoform X2 n=1 Tax=Myxocyprinus asiaticus TaxID=70543 RepID=UPI00222205C0|nr:uncharacterized protein LOC127444145 isoform X2 [Myxocyprinus asiaticus]